MPWGRHKGIRIRLIPSDYLSWLTTTPMLQEARWKWLHDSVIAELKFRGYEHALADSIDPVVPISDSDRTLPERKVRKQQEF